MSLEIGLDVRDGKVKSACSVIGRDGLTEGDTAERAGLAERETDREAERPAVILISITITTFVSKFTCGVVLEVSGIEF
jgi:hypothetical protein